jgi:ribosome-binding factor A
MARGRRSTGGHKYPRSARVGETLREIIAEELVRIDDERLTFVTVTGIEVDDELNRAHVFFDSLAGEDGDDEIVEALASHRVRLQSAIARQIRAKKTPILHFRPDVALRSAERIDDILREDRRRRGGDGGTDASADATASDD